MGVTVYLKPSCVQCNAIYRALRKHRITYTVIDVTEDRQAYRHVTDLGYQQVPVVETDHEHWCGYRPDKISTLAGARTGTDE